jgi:hypothetical protein
VTPNAVAQSRKKSSALTASVCGQSELSNRTEPSNAHSVGQSGHINWALLLGHSGHAPIDSSVTIDRARC